jgi:hypothetical protein
MNESRNPRGYRAIDLTANCEPQRLTSLRVSPHSVSRNQSALSCEVTGVSRGDGSTRTELQELLMSGAPNARSNALRGRGVQP